MKQGISRRQADIKLGKEYSVSESTVIRWIEPQYRTVDILLKKKRRKKIKESAELSLQKREYEKKYRRVTRHLPYWIEAVFRENRASLSINSISKILKEKTGIKIEASTLEKTLRACKQETGYSPLTTMVGKNGVQYRLGTLFYRFNKNVGEKII